jgi:putative DNA primase/helicase
MGVEARLLTGKHGPCPICGGKDRFRWDDKDGTGSYFCSGCGPGDGFMLAEKVTGKTFKELFVLVQDNIGTVPMPEIKPKTDDQANRMAMRAVWEAAGTPSEHSLVGLYQKNRLGRLWPSTAIREAAGLRYGTAEMHPAMVARISDPQDRGVNMHLTFLTDDGRKADIEPVKKVMKGTLPDGCAIRLWPAARIMGIAEGIESAMSAAILYKMPVWAAINSTMLAKWVPPDEAEEIWVFGDNDGNFAGQAKSYALAHRLVAQFGRQVRVEIPYDPGMDWNDILKKEKGA